MSCTASGSSSRTPGSLARISLDLRGQVGNRRRRTTGPFLPACAGFVLGWRPQLPGRTFRAAPRPACQPLPQCSPAWTRAPPGWRPQQQGILGRRKQLRACREPVRVPIRATAALPAVLVRRAAELEDVRADAVIGEVREVHAVVPVQRMGGALRLQPGNRQRIVAAQIHVQVRQQLSGTTSAWPSGA